MDEETAHPKIFSFLHRLSSSYSATPKDLFGHSHSTEMLKEHLVFYWAAEDMYHPSKEAIHKDIRISWPLMTIHRTCKKSLWPLKSVVPCNEDSLENAQIFKLIWYEKTKIFSRMFVICTGLIFKTRLSLVIPTLYEYGSCSKNGRNCPPFVFQIHISLTNWSLFDLLVHLILA